jgi:hypothetical protein
MFEFSYILFSQKRRFIPLGIYFAICLLFICLSAPVVQAYHSNISSQIKLSYSNQNPSSTYNGSNAITIGLSQITYDVTHDAAVAEAKMLTAVIALSTNITNFDKETIQIPRDVAVSTAHGITIGVADYVHTVGSVYDITKRQIVSGFGLFHDVSYARSIIQPKDNMPIPTITQLRIQQAVLIQSDTTNVSVAAITTGAGGACDDGNGNGGYPMSWCNAPIDSTSTIPYTSDPINRECTSYAYWYFVDVEGNTGFQAWGNAKYWATSSNYPTRTTPVVGAIAVETTGAYGHVAIVQALPGQEYAGQVVPAGYVLVSEMNYDWHGHFRYSYSPLSKFSAYIW